jgi:hypothetical protein
MIVPAYQVVCDGCGIFFYISNLANKKELADELTARGWLVKGLCSEVYCPEGCAGLD